MLMLSDYDLSDIAWHWPHFSAAELACKCEGRYCAGEYWHAPDFLDGLEALRADMGGPLIIHSAHRCKGWNAHVGGAKRSQHLHIAADIRLARHDRFRLRDSAIARGFTGIGMARTFLHIDRRATPARWYYPGTRMLWQK